MVAALKYTPMDLVHLAVERYGQAGTARVIGRTPGAVTLWLQGKRQPDFESRYKLCEALGILRDDVEIG